MTVKVTCVKTAARIRMPFLFADVFVYTRDDPRYRGIATTAITSRFAPSGSLKTKNNTLVMKTADTPNSKRDFVFELRCRIYISIYEFVKGFLSNKNHLPTVLLKGDSFLQIISFQISNLILA